MIQMAVSREQIVAFCRRHRIRRLAVFGSAVRNDFGPDSDVDVLVEFEVEAASKSSGAPRRHRNLYKPPRQLLLSGDRLRQGHVTRSRPVIHMISEFDANKRHLIQDGNLLSTEATVDELIGRQAEIERLKTSLAPLLRGQPPLNAWVCGPPGCGKTLLARRAVENICSGAASRVGAYVNCWQHRSLHSVLGAIVGQLKILGAEAQDTNVKLDRVRQALRGRPTIIILDEVDRPMPAQREEIIYGLLGLPKCALACIANGTQTLATMDERVRSRLSPVVIRLSPYSAKELEVILTDRARQALAPNSCTPAVLKRIAAVANGDARVAIQILRQAATAAEMSGNTKLNTRLVERCLRPWRLVRQEARLAGLSEHEKILFEQVKQHGPLGAFELARRYTAYCQSRNIQPMARRTFTKYLSRLSAAGLLETSGQPPGPGGQIVRAITADP